ncbi:MAG: deoxyribodipyrimidine photo-lyase [Devosia sp.]
MSRPSLLWLRNDLRLLDNAALRAAVATGDSVVAIYVHETDPTLRKRGAASRWWLHHSLNALAPDLAAHGIRLEVIDGSILDAVEAHRPGAVFWNRRYGPAEREADGKIKAGLKAEGIHVGTFAGSVLVEPFDIATKTGGPYAVYTPFWNTLRERDIRAPSQAPRRTAEPLKPQKADADYIAPAWSKKLEKHWSIGEEAAKRRLHDFLDGDVSEYPDARDLPAKAATSRLSPHLAFGEISARQVWHVAQSAAHRSPGEAASIQKFLMELAWRDFNIHQLYHRPDIAEQPMQEKFKRLKWRKSAAELRAWQRGETGIPIVDAGMREMWETGFMQNRVRMLTASLLAKNLLLDWHLGEQWFWDCLVDADPANNPGNWQWVAGCGNDASPYFRIFNPVTQAEKFDPDGDYVQRWAPQEEREPIVDLKSSRERALEAFKAL